MHELLSLARDVRNQPCQPIKGGKLFLHSAVFAGIDNLGNTASGKFGRYVKHPFLRNWRTNLILCQPFKAILIIKPDGIPTKYMEPTVIP